MNIIYARTDCLVTRNAATVPRLWCYNFSSWQKHTCHMWWLPKRAYGNSILTACSNTKFQLTNSHKRLVVYLSLISFTAGAHVIRRAGSTSGFICIVGQEIWDRVTLPLHLTGSFVSTKQVYHTTTAAGMGGMRVHSHVNGKVSAGTMY